MISIREAANFFLSRSAIGTEFEITPKKLQKLVYYAQAWYLATHDHPLFEEDFQAWVHGPVHPGLYHQYSEFRHNPLPVYQEFDSSTIPSEIQVLLNEIWGVYGRYNGDELEYFTHLERPWQEARRGYKPHQHCNRVIHKGTMQSFYRNLMNGEVAAGTPVIDLNNVAITSERDDDNFSTVSSLLEFAGIWVGDDLDELLQEVYSRRKDVSLS